MVSRTYRAGMAKSIRRRTYRRVHGGSIESVTKLLEDTPVVIDDKINLINKDSKFIVATYWWGKANMNRNLQSPCPEDIMDIVKHRMVAVYGRKYGFGVKEYEYDGKTYPGFLPEYTTTVNQLKMKREKEDLTEEETDTLRNYQSLWTSWTNTVFDILKKDPSIKQTIDALNARYTEIETSKTGKPARGFPEMIEEWRKYCVDTNVNYVSLNVEFPRNDYQNAINGKPLFIKRVLDAVKGKGPGGSDLGVLYIDGDMWMLKYPHIFDIDNVDFMARGWNMDPRSKEKAIKKPAYDPYIFETSGGTMYFGNTDAARRLLDKWAESSAKQPGKADDRILSQVFTTQTLVLGTNIINLPIEYLWLTDNYVKYLNSPEKPASIEDAYIEHHYCLTGEERAAGQGAAANREPEGYEEEITDEIRYDRDPELFYEYIFFDGDKKKRDGFGRYLNYMRKAIGYWSEKPLIGIVKFDAKYGRFTAIAEKNLAGIQDRPQDPTAVSTSSSPALSTTSEPAAPQPMKLPPKFSFSTNLSPFVMKKPVTPLGQSPPKQGLFASVLAPKKGGAAPESVVLPLSTPIPEILKALAAKTDVHLGEKVPHEKEDECVAVDISTSDKADVINSYTRRLRIDTTKPIFLSSKSRVLFHLLAMCETLKDINRHIYGSYMFMSRIRWNLLKGGETQTESAESQPMAKTTLQAPKVKEGVAFKPTVHQIWFGGEMPEWRKRIFNDNRTVCEKCGFTYKLWKNQDRTEENFPQTFAYQNTAIDTGKETGQSRWAQVADLARLEIVYNSSGIYVDSIVEISPALLFAVVNAINDGATFVGCNEDACEPKLDCKNSKGEMYLSNSFFAATKASPLFKELLSEGSLEGIDFNSTELNHTTGPYFLRAGVEKVKSEIKPFLFESAQIYQFNKQETPYKGPNPDRFLVPMRLPCSIQYTTNPPGYYLPGGVYVLQDEHLEKQNVATNLPELEKTQKIVETKGPLAVYHSGLGGTWST